MSAHLGSEHQRYQDLGTLFSCGHTFLCVPVSQKGVLINFLLPFSSCFYVWRRLLLLY
jgi:hypothetical protein